MYQVTRYVGFGVTLLGIVLAVIFSDPAYNVVSWLGLAMLPWLAAMAVVVAPKPRERVKQRLGELRRQPGVTPALLIGMAVVLLLMELLGADAAALTVSWGVGALIVLSAFVPARRVGAAIVGVTMTLVTAIVILDVAEIAFRHPALNARLGLVQERERWSVRSYDDLAQGNFFGFRSPVESVHKGDRFRIVTLGDSFTWGDKVRSTPEIWPSRIQSALDAWAPGSYEVVNMGKNGYTTANEAELMHRVGWQFEPDLLIVQFFLNDALESGPNFTSRDPKVHKRLMPRRLVQGRARRSALLDAVEQVWSNAHYSPEAVQDYWRGLYEEDSPGWTQMRAAFRDIASEAADREVPVLLVMFPYFFPGEWTAETYPYKGINDKVRSAAQEAGLLVLDLTPSYACEDGRQWWATPWDAHPSPAGHALAARVILEELDERGLVTARRTALYEGGNSGP